MQPVYGSAKPVVVLMRYESSDEGTFGVMVGPDGLQTYSLELPWRNNRFNLSCIPRGRYEVAWTLSPRFKRYTFHLLNTAPRSGIRIHPANVAGDTTKGYRNQLAGCIAPGSRIGQLSGQKAVLESGKALLEYEDALDQRSHILIIDGVVG